MLGAFSHKAFRSPVLNTLGGRRRGRQRRCTNPVFREKKHEHRPGPPAISRTGRTADHPHPGIMLAYNFTAHPETKASSSRFLGGKEGLKDPQTGGRGHAAAAVRNEQANPGGPIRPRTGAP